jgi:hypothetical protein
MSDLSALHAKFGHCAPDQSAEPVLVAYRGAQIAPLSRSGSHLERHWPRKVHSNLQIAKPSIREALEETGGGPLGWIFRRRLG